MRQSRRGHARFIVIASTVLALSALVADPLTTAAAVKALALAWVSVVFIVYTTFVLPRPNAAARVHVSFADVGALGFLALSTLSLLWGTRAGLPDLALWGSALALACALRRHAAGVRQRLLDTTSLIICGASGLWGITERVRHLEVTAGQGNPDWLGLTLAVALPVCVGQLRARRLRIVKGVIVSLGVAALYLSHSRTGWIAATIASALVFVAPRFGTSNLAPGASAAFLAPAIGSRTAAFHEAGTLRAWSGRLWIYERSADVALAHPLRGVGLGRYGFGYLEAQGEALARLPTQEAARRFINATTAHDDYMQIACESGVPAAILFVWALFRAGRALLWRRSHGALGALVAFAICALGDSPLRLTAPVLLLALVFANVRDARPSANALRARATLVAQTYLPVVVAISAGATAACNYASVRLRTRAALVATAAQEHLLERATELDLTGDAELDLGLYRLAKGPENVAAAERHLRISSTRLANAGTFVALGNALAAQNRLREAKGEYERAVGLHPGSLKAQLNLAEVDRRLGDLAAARRHMEAARIIAPYHPKLLDLVDRIDVDDANALSEELERIDVDDDADPPR